MPTSFIDEIPVTRIPNAKQRSAALRARRSLDVRYRCLAAEKIQRRLLQSSIFFRSRTIACYFAMHDEVDTGLIFERAWRAGKSIFAPVVGRGRSMKFVRVKRESRLVRNNFGVWEPVSGHEISPRTLDCVITPLVAFDESNNRIGMGGGYYDRTFSFLRMRRAWLRPKLLGLAFDCQKVEKITPNPWDIRLYRVFDEFS